MAFTSFKDWMLAHESSPQTRLRRDAALGLKPTIVTIHSKSTASPFEVEELVKQLKRKRRGREQGCGCKSVFDESEKKMPKNPQTEKFLASIESLKSDLKALEDAVEKKKLKPEKPKEEEPPKDKKPEEEPKEEPDDKPESKEPKKPEEAEEKSEDQSSK